MPHSLRYDKAANFLYASQNLQYALLFDAPTDYDEFLLSLLSDDVKDSLKKNFPTVTAEQADLNFDGIRLSRHSEVTAKLMSDWQDAAKFFVSDDAEDNVQNFSDYAVLKDYIELCLANGAKPVGVIFPFAPIVRKNCDRKILNAFREMIHRLEENHDFTCVDMFELSISYDCFCDMMHLNEIGQSFTNSLISLKLWQMNLLATEGFCEITYDYFHRLATRSPKDDYNELMERVLEISVARIRRKKKIKVGFALIEAGQWCGDDLYNLFARDERFEVTIFFSMNFQRDTNDLTENDFQRGVEQFKSHGLNVVAITEINATIPEQDVIIYLTPYINYSTGAFRLQSITAKTLLAHIFYALDSSIHVKSFYNGYMFLVLWRMFYSSTIQGEVFRNNSIIDMPRGYYSGYPRMDIFFKRDTSFHFEWKMARPDAKKIIYAPHHSIEGASVTYSTFHWNYQFMYEFAKAHPEISWVVKPHPWLLYKAVRYKVFPTAEAFNEYLQAWNNLPNAQVYTGAYYQHIFATSDGMIHDCGSFKAEYQYVDKPMIYLRRAEQVFNEQGNKILEASYCVDGQDLDAIAATMQRVFIDGDDYKAAERRAVFDKYLNYPKANGMLASEFIYHSIADELKEAAK